MFKMQDRGFFPGKLSALLLICLFVTAVGVANAADTTGNPARVVNPVQKTDMIFGISWMPGLCEKMSETPECSRQGPGSLDSRQFSLSGLWRMRQTYCGVDAALKAQDGKRDWLAMPALVLASAVQSQLKEAMPGVVSGYDRHQWVKYGTCSGLAADAYYQRSLRLLQEVNASAVGRLFADNPGRPVREADVKAAFDASFGPGAGNRVKMRCSRDGERRVITGLTIGLGKVEGEGADLASLIAAARETKFGCSEGVVDEAGFQ